MKKFSVLLAVSFVAVFALVFAGCGAPVEKPVPVTPPTETQPENSTPTPAQSTEPAPAAVAPAPVDPAAPAADPAAATQDQPASGEALTGEFDDFDYTTSPNSSSKAR